jgi:caffeoyl-CoA O-methyltransferase
MKKNRNGFVFLLSALFVLTVKNMDAQDNQNETQLDKQVKAFLDSHSNSWHDMNVPESDGKLLYNLIVKNKYKNAVEIGTSTGHSSIWMAWALSKTGGKLITVEIDEKRHKEALANFEKAGVSEFIDARLADAHELVPKLTGPVDFVFSDADKDWYTNYFKAMDPKLKIGGCFTAHNIGMAGVNEFFEYISKLPYYKTTVDRNGAGMSISYKTGSK